MSANYSNFWVLDNFSYTFSSERELTYEYGGDLGHDMPFHGIGPLAVDILKGECLIHYLVSNGYYILNGTVYRRVLKNKIKNK